MPLPETVKNLILKIKALADRGIDGEAESAKTKLEMLLNKHNVRLEDLMEDQVLTFKFAYKTTREEILIVQCYASLDLPYSCAYSYKRAGRKQKILGLDLTPSKYLDLKEMIAYYNAALEKEMDRLYTAFIHKHDLGRPPKDGKKPTRMSQEERENLSSMMRGLKEKSYVRPVAKIAY